MNTFKLPRKVRLARDVPALWLRRGEVGVVCSLWFSPLAAYEVEFDPNSQHCKVRALLFPEQLELDREGSEPAGEDKCQT